MDSWQVAQNYLIATAFVGVIGGYYYYTAKQKKPNRTGKLITPRRSETDLRGRSNAKRDIVPNGTTGSRQNSAARKRKVRAEPPQVRHKPSLEVIADEKPAKESDMSAAQFASQMQQARQGTNLQTSKSKDARVKTVKARAVEEPIEESVEEVEDKTAGDVSDMLEPKATGPTTIRITAPTEPQRTKVVREKKQEVVETKKQRQRRRQAEERKAQNAEDEAERKVLEERQRRTAREARGEAAKNGVPAQPVNNPWEQRNAETAASVQAADAIRGPLLDTFDAESTSSSNGGPGESTAATSTTSGEQPRWDSATEQEQLDAALKQSVDESGWTTISTTTKKKGKKIDSGAITPVKENGKAVNGSANSGAYAALQDGAWDA